MEALASFLGRNGFLPHGYCFTWSPGVLWTMVGADSAIAAAYFSMPVTMLAFFVRRRDVALRPLIVLFSAFIFACGVTHVLGIWTIWQPDYGVQALSKLVTAVISIVTAGAMWQLLPRALTIPSAGELQAVVARLQTEAAQRRSAEDTLAEVQENLAVTLASIGAGFLACDRHGRVARMNRIAEDLLGWREDHARGVSLWDVLVREDTPPEHVLRNPVDLMLEQDITMAQPHRVVVFARDGKRTPVEITAALTHAPDGSVRGLAMVLRDLTATVRAEETSARLAAIVESSSDAIIGKTLQGRITSWNRAAEAMLGYRADEAIGEPIQMLIPPDRQAEEMAILARLSRGEAIQTFETQRVARDGRLIEVSLAISPIRDAQGHIVGASKIARDITPLRQAEQSRRMALQLEAENRQVQESSRLKSLFLANMSHELRTPLNAVIGFADLLQMGVVKHDSPKHAEYLGHISSSGRHLLQLINDVLDLSKVESGHFEFHPESIDLQALVTDALNLLRAEAERKQITLHQDIDARLPALHLDPARLKQAIYNYLSNAIKFTPNGGRVMVRAEPEGGSDWKLEVEDTGIGIAAADLPLLFTEFQQLDAGHSKQHAGTGLGLALTRRLVEAQGGTVGVRSTPGQGSVFHLVLPCVHRPAAGGDRSGERLLVIEGDELQQSQLVGIASKAGFKVDGVGTSEAAQRKALVVPYGALTLAMWLPDGHGLATLASIRSGGPSKDSPVLGLSVRFAPGRVAMLPVNDLLSKPLCTAEVAQALSRTGLVRPARIMVVDDDPLAQQLMHAHLASAGHAVTVASGGREAIEVLQRDRHDAVVLDLMMPGFNGFETLDEIRRMPAMHDLPVFIWTSLMLTDDEAASLAHSADAVLLKGGGGLQPLVRALQRWRTAGADLAGSA